MKTGSGDDPFVIEEDEEPEQTEPENERQDIPWIFTRENVKTDRDMVQFYLRDETTDQEADFIDTLENTLGTSVSKTDAREAAYLAAMGNPEIVAEELRDWGFDLKG